MAAELRSKLASSVSKIEKPGDSRWNRWLKNPSVEKKVFFLKPDKTVPREFCFNFTLSETEEHICILPIHDLINKKSFEKFLKIKASRSYSINLPVSKTYRLFFSVLKTACSEDLIPDFPAEQFSFERFFQQEENVVSYLITQNEELPEISGFPGIFPFSIKENSRNISNNLVPAIKIREEDIYDQNHFSDRIWRYFSETIISSNLLQSYLDVNTSDISAYLFAKPEVSVSLLPASSVIYVSLLSIKDFVINLKEIKNIQLASGYSPFKISLENIGPKKVYKKKVSPLQSKISSFEFIHLDNSDISPDYFEYYPIKVAEVKDLNNQIVLNSKLQVKDSEEKTATETILIDGNEFINNPVLAVPERKTNPHIQRQFTYHQDGIDFLINNSFAILGDEPGLGKNTQVVKSLKILLRKGVINNALIICSKQDMGNSQLSSKSFAVEGWEGAFYFWAPEVTIGNYGEKCQITFAFTGETDTTEQNMLNQFKKSRFDCVVIDKINISETSRIFFREIKKLYPKFVWITSSIFEDEAEKIITFYYEDKHLSAKDIKEKLSWVYLRRKKAALTKDLPVKLETTKWFYLSEKQKIEYDSLLFQGEIKIYSTLEKGNIYIIRPHIFTLLHQLLQVCNFISDEKESEKSKYLVNLILHTTDKVIVFSQYEKFGLDRLSFLLDEKNIKHHVIKTNTSLNVQANILDSFENSDVRVLLADSKAINRRLNMKEFVTIVHFDSWWNPAVKWQTEDKIRTAPGYPISIYNLVTRDTIHEKIYTILSEKGLYVKSILGQFSINFMSELISTEEWLNMLGVKTPEIQEPQLSKIQKFSESNFPERVKEFFGFLGFKKIKSTEEDARKNIIIFSKVNNTYEESIFVQYKYVDFVTQQEVVNFYSSISGYKNISHFYLVTSGEFSPECRKYLVTKSENITLINGRKISYFFSIFK